MRHLGPAKPSTSTVLDYLRLTLAQHEYKVFARVRLDAQNLESI